MWRLVLLLPLWIGTAAAAETTVPFPQGVYWPWERLQDLRTGKRLEVEQDGMVTLRLEAGDGTVLQMP